MQMTKNGIPIDFPGHRKKVAQVQIVQKQNDFNKFTKFATMVGFEEGCRVTAVVPMGHPDFKVFLAQGYKVIDIWGKKIREGETA